MISHGRSGTVEHENKAFLVTFICAARVLRQPSSSLCGQPLDPASCRNNHNSFIQQLVPCAQVPHLFSVVTALAPVPMPNRRHHNFVLPLRVPEAAKAVLFARVGLHSDRRHCPAQTLVLMPAAQQRHLTTAARGGAMGTCRSLRSAIPAGSVCDLWHPQGALGGPPSGVPRNVPQRPASVAVNAGSRTPPRDRDPRAGTRAAPVCPRRQEGCRHHRRRCWCRNGFCRCRLRYVYRGHRRGWVQVASSRRRRRRRSGKSQTS